ncbi:MAG: LPP20 family lipoprotein [Bacteroidales bacterium]
MKLSQSIPWLFIMSIILSLYSCSSLNISAGNKKQPEWVEKRPIDNEYYIGIGNADTYEDNYAKVAKNYALTDLISEISIKLSSNSILRQLEDNSGFKEEFEAVIKMNMKDELEGYEIVDSWKGEDKYWVYYRLSKEEYKKIKQEKLEKAKSLAKNYYEQAANAKEKNDIHNALNYYVKAFEAVNPHLDEDLSVFTLEGRVDLVNGIYQNIQEIFSAIEFEPDKTNYDLKTLTTDNPLISATTYYNENGKRQPIKNLSVTFSFPDLSVDTKEKTTSNSRGIINCSIAEMLPKGKQQKIKVKLNTETYFGSGKNLLTQMFAKDGNIPYQYININVSEVNAYLETNETKFGKISTNQPVAKVFKEKLSENFFSFVDNTKDADVIIKVESNTTEGKFVEKYNLYTAFINCNISITNNKTSQEIYSEGISNVKGMKTGSYKMAAQDALEKAKKEIQEKIISEIRKLNY